MNRIVLDTNVISETMRERPDAVALRWFAAQAVENLYLTSITLAELWYGVERLGELHPKHRGLTAKLEVLEQQFENRVLDFDAAAARRWGQMKGSHGRTGRVYPDIDLQIAAIVGCHDASLATNNVRDFDGLGLRLINPFR